MAPTPPVISRADAKAAGLKSYFTGEPCKNGHVRKNNVRTGACYGCLDESNAKWRSSPDVKKARSARSSAWNRVHREEQTRRKREWRAKNGDRSRAIWHAKKARALEQMGFVSPDIRERLRNLQGGECACCGAKLTTVKECLDHIMPLALGGLHDDANLQLLCEPCNCSKGAKHPLDFARERADALER